MKYIGAHVSAAGGVSQAPARAAEIGATGFALFVKNQRQWSASPLDPGEISAFSKALEETGYPSEAILPHDGYLINLGNPDPEKRGRSLDSFLQECSRAESLGLTLLNFHPGSHLKEIDEEACLDLIAEGMAKALAETEELVLVIENTAGQGSAVGYRFAHLGGLIDRLDGHARVGVCIDTCHAWAAGYRWTEDYDGVWGEFEETVGFDRLRGMHLNDAKKEVGSRVDRHAPLGDGTIGRETFSRLAADTRLDGIPFILETPDPERWAEEIAFLRESTGDR